MTSTPRPSPSPAPISAEEIRHTTFRQSQLAWRGYSEDDVDAFKEAVADQLVEAERERAALRAEIERLRNFYREQGTNIDAVRGGRHHHPRVPELIRRISDHADVQMGHAREYARLVLEQTGDQAEELLYQAEVRSSLAVEEWLRARREAGRPVQPDELRHALTWLRSFTFALQVELKVVDDVLVREAQRPEAPPVEQPHW